MPKTKRGCAKKTTKKTVKKTAGKPTEKKIGEVIHYFGKIKVAVVKLKTSGLKTGDKIHVKGATTDFKFTVKSMQIEHKVIKTARKGQIVGLKVSKQVRRGDSVYLVK